MEKKHENLGATLGLRKKFIRELTTNPPAQLKWFEIHPENYMDRGGMLTDCLDQISETYPIVCHGLSLSIGSVEELDWEYLKRLKAFLKKYNVPWYSDHLCFTYKNGQNLHDLLPLPFTKETIKHVSERARIVQDYLEIPFALENVSSYLVVTKPEMSELEFTHEILNQSGCKILLDINNAFVNQFNHGLNAKEFIESFQREQIAQIHIAGHYQESENLIIDSHGEEVCEDVWKLLNDLGKKMPLPPILIERDNNIPELSEILKEVRYAQEIYNESHRSFTKKVS